MSGETVNLIIKSIKNHANVIYSNETKNGCKYESIMRIDVIILFDDDDDKFLFGIILNWFCISITW